MLTRLYIDNFRCFVNFEYKPTPRQLILGRNGSGKSSLLDALLFVRQFAINGDKAEDYNIIHQRTRWMTKKEQTCEIEATLDGGQYVYRLLIDEWGEVPRPRVLAETVHLDGNPIFEFKKGEVHLFNDQFVHKVTYPFDWHRSALATITARPENQKLTRFRQWLASLLCFRINPYAMTARAEGEDLAPKVDLSNIAAWYRHLVQAYRKEDAALLDSLRAVLDDFRFLELSAAGENIRLLLCEFAHGDEPGVKFGFNELSEGQRCLICLYAILHFVIANGGTVILDEPDNFVSLREIQPWLVAVSDLIEDGKGQVIVISHHPELINQWAPNSGVVFVRSGTGPVRVEEFRGEPASSLSPAELVARGWERV
jgi:predicted ATPase